MIKTIIHGCNGKMGKVLEEIIAQDENMEIIAGIDQFSGANNSFKIYNAAHECAHQSDVIIDFSHHSAIEELLDYCITSKTPVVVATTALSGENMSQIFEASKIIPVFQSANMSLGINVLSKVSKEATMILEDGFDIEIIEKHHNKKVDAPSGTAFLIANAINDACKVKKDFVYGRYGKADQRNASDLGIHAIRGGTIPGEHSVIFAGDDEIIEIKHTALSKNIFAHGAIKAAKFLATADAGFYNMNDII